MAECPQPEYRSIRTLRGRPPCRGSYPFLRFILFRYPSNTPLIIFRSVICPGIALVIFLACFASVISLFFTDRSEEEGCKTPAAPQP